MKLPKIEAKPGLYKFTYDEYGLYLVLNRMRNTRDKFTGELNIKLRQPDMSWDHLYFTRYDLISDRARTEVSNKLEFRYSTDIWLQIIEWISMHILNKERSGEPPTLISEVPDDEGLTWRMPGLLLENEPTVFFGNGGSMKSYLAAYVAFSVTMGLNGAQHGNVLYLDYEGNEKTLRKRIRMIAEGIGESVPNNLWYLTGYQPVVDDYERIENYVIEHDIEVLMVDAAGDAVGGKVNEAEAPIAYFNALRALKATNLSIAHNVKNMDNNAQMPFGSAYWHNKPRATYEIKSSDIHGESAVTLGIFNRKANESRKLAPQGYKVSFYSYDLSRYTYGDWARFETASIADLENSEVAKDIPMTTRILNHIRDNPCTTKELAEVFNKSTDDIRSYCSRLKTQIYKPIGQERWFPIETETPP